MTCNLDTRRFVDSQSADNSDEIAEKIDFDKHYFDNETEKTEKIDAEIEMIVAEIATDEYYCYIDRIAENEHFV